MSVLTTLLGETVQAKDGRETKLVSELVGEENVVGIYFSNVSTPFTSKLVAWYNDFKKTANGSKFEIVLVSSDYCLVDYDEQPKENMCTELPWLALQYDKQDKKAALMQKFMIKTDDKDILVLINSLTGRTITRNGHSVVSEDPKGKYFPWTSKSIMKIIRDACLLTNKSFNRWEDIIEGDYVGLYFSAHWCKPCDAFTFQLTHTYKTINAGGVKKFEVILVSSDRSEEAFTKYYDGMPWLALDFNDRRQKILSRVTKVTKLPTLIILDKNTGTLITRNGTGAIWGDTNGKHFPWFPKLVQKLMKYTNFSTINEQPAVIWVTDPDSEENKKVCKIMTIVSLEYHRVVRDVETHEKLSFLYSLSNSEEASRIRDFFKVPADKKSFLCVTNAPEQRVYICKEDKITTDVVRGVVEKIITNELDWQRVESPQE